MPGEVVALSSPYPVVVTGGNSARGLRVVPRTGGNACPEGYAYPEGYTLHSAMSDTTRGLVGGVGGLMAGSPGAVNEEFGGGAECARLLAPYHHGLREIDARLYSLPSQPMYSHQWGPGEQNPIGGGYKAADRLAPSSCTLCTLSHPACVGHGCQPLWEGAAEEVQCPAGFPCELSTATKQPPVHVGDPLGWGIPKACEGTPWGI